MKALGLLIVLAVLAAGTVEGLAQLRTKRPIAAAAAAPVPPAAVAEQPAAPAEAEEADITVSDDSEEAEPALAEVKSEADETTEDGSNDESVAEDSRSAAAPADTPIHEHFRQFTKPMELLPVELVESDARAHADDEGEGEGKGSNPTYILPVDPFNYFPFFNGFSNVNPFSQFYPPAPYLYPQYTNYMHRYANHAMPPHYGAGAYSHGGHGWGGHGADWMGHGHGGMYAGHGGGWGGGGYPHPHMSYPFGAYKLDVSGPDVRSGANNPEPFPQFSELASNLITPEIIPKEKDESDVAADEAEDVAETERIAQPVQLEVETLEAAEQQQQLDAENEAQAQADANDEGEEEVEADEESESEAESEDEIEADEASDSEEEDSDSVVQAAAIVSDDMHSSPQSIENQILANAEAEDDTNEVEFMDEDNGPEMSSEDVVYKD